MSSSQAFEKARADVGVIDTMIGFPAPREEQAKHYDFIRKQTHDADSQEWEFPAQYMFKGVPHYDKVDDPVAGGRRGVERRRRIRWFAVGPAFLP